MDFEIIDFERIAGYKSAQYQFTINFADIAVYGCRVYNWGPGKPPFVACQPGKTSYRPL